MQYSIMRLPAAVAVVLLVHENASVGTDLDVAEEKCKRGGCISAEHDAAERKRLKWRVY